MAHTLTLTAPRQLEFTEVDHERALEPGEVRLRSLISAISHGTELNLYRGTSPFGSRTFDRELRAFVGTDGDPRPSYPIAMGYEMVSEVVEVGPGVEQLQPGARVHTGTPHQDATIVRLDDLEEAYPLTVLPPGGDVRRALFVSLTAVALQAVHDAQIKLGDVVVVSGLGAIGLLTVQLARLSGADTVIALDPSSDRRTLAGEYGAVTLDPLASDAPGADVKRRNDKRGADVAIETSGVAAGLHNAIASVGIGGRVVSVGYYQGDATGLRLGEEWHHNRPTMLSSMGVWGCPHRDHPAWQRKRMADTSVKLLFSGALDTTAMLSRIAPFASAPAEYERLCESPTSAIKVALAFPAYEPLAAAVRRASPSSAT